MSLINPAVVTAQQVEDWAKVGQVSKMETAVYQGFGDLVTGLGKVWNEDARNFIKKVPEKIVSRHNYKVGFQSIFFQKQIEEIHSLVGKSDTESFSNIDVSKYFPAQLRGSFMSPNVRTRTSCCPAMLREPPPYWWLLNWEIPA